MLWTASSPLWMHNSVGQHVALVNFLSQVHPMRTRRDVDNYLARLSRVAPVLDGAVPLAVLGQVIGADIAATLKP